MNRAKRITQYFVLSFALCGLLSFVQPAAAADEKEAPVVAAERVAASDGAVTASGDFKRAIPKVRQGTPVVGGKKGLTVLATCFFLVSVFMVTLFFRGAKEGDKGAH